LVVDLSKIAPYVFAAWLIKKCNKLPGNHHINVDRKQISVDDPKAIELIRKEIDYDKND